MGLKSQYNLFWPTQSLFEPPAAVASEPPLGPVPLRECAHTIASYSPRVSVLVFEFVRVAFALRQNGSILRSVLSCSMK